MRITIKNAFHGTSATISVRHHKDDFPEFFRISDRAFRRAERKLCGIPGCRCANSFGNSAIWPPTPVDPQQESRYWLIEVVAR